MKPSLIKKALGVALDAQRPTFIWGPPGVGKSQVVRQVASARGLALTDLRAVLLDPVDLRGLPHVNGDGRAHWCPPEFLPFAGEGILFLDELNAAPQLVQAACYQLVLDRRLGEYILPDGWHVVAAGNRETDRAVTSRMPSALANRFIHLTMEVDIEDWVSWALQSSIRTEVIAFIRFRPALLHAFDPSAGSKAFPSPRSWEFVSNLLSASPAPEIEYELISGTVGEGAAAEFVAFAKVFRGLPNADAVLMAPDTAPVPEDPATLYALCGALSARASEQNFGRLVQYANRLPAEFSVLVIRDSVRRVPELTSTRPFIEWAAAHAEVLI